MPFVSQMPKLGHTMTAQASQHAFGFTEGRRDPSVTHQVDMAGHIDLDDIAGIAGDEARDHPVHVAVDLDVETQLPPPVPGSPFSDDPGQHSDRRVRDAVHESAAVGGPPLHQGA